MQKCELMGMKHGEVKGNDQLRDGTGPEPESQNTNCPGFKQPSKHTALQGRQPLVIWMLRSGGLEPTASEEPWSLAPGAQASVSFSAKVGAEYHFFSPHRATVGAHETEVADGSVNTGARHKHSCSRSLPRLAADLNRTLPVVCCLCHRQEGKGTSEDT